jgi:zinc transport system ATP-binding protein
MTEPRSTNAPGGTRGDPAVCLKGVTVRYGESVVLDRIHLDVPRGSFQGLIGPNGGGKTTLLKAILGLVPIAEGEIRVLGRTGRDLDSVRGLVGYVPQRTANERDFPATALDVVLMGRYARIGILHLATRADREKARRALELVGMNDRAERPVGQLSGGEQQRVFIARALASEAELLLLDEPTTGVDVVAQEEFFQLLRRLQSELGLTILLATHDIGAVSTHVDQVGCLNRRLFYHGHPREGLTPELLEDLYGKEVRVMVHQHDRLPSPAGDRGDRA